VRSDRFADVWGVHDFVAAVVVLAGVALVLVGQWLDSSLLSLAGGVAVVVGMAVFIVWRVAGGSGRSRHDDWV
jgi:hypothetical protein